MPSLASARECWLHRSRAICAFALAFWTLVFLLSVGDLAGISAIRPQMDRISIVAYTSGVWLFGQLADRCGQKLERLFYMVGAGDSLILCARAAISMPGRVLWVGRFLNAALSATEIALSGAIILWHFRSRGTNSRP